MVAQAGRISEFAWHERKGGAPSGVLVRWGIGIDSLPGIDIRFYNMICLVYGKNPKVNADLVNEGLLPEARAERCPEEYKQKLKAWDKLLGPHKKRGEFKKP